MTVARDKIVELVREQLPVGVLQKSNELLYLWIEDACDEVMLRIKRTTIMEAEITLVEGQYTYNLPEGCTRVQDILLQGARDGSDFFPGIPSDQLPNVVSGPFAMLPSGQSISPSLDLIARQDRARNDREVQFRTLGGKLVIDFLPESGKKVTLVYEGTDRDAENLPRKHWSAVIKKCMAEAIGVGVVNMAMSGDAVGDHLASVNVGELRRQKQDLDKEWERYLGGLLPEP